MFNRNGLIAIRGVDFNHRLWCFTTDNTFTSYNCGLDEQTVYEKIRFYTMTSVNVNNLGLARFCF